MLSRLPKLMRLRASESLLVQLGLRNPKKGHKQKHFTAISLHPYWASLQGGLYRSFRKLGIPYFGVLIVRILVFRVLYGGPLFSETSKRDNPILSFAYVHFWTVLWTAASWQPEVPQKVSGRIRLGWRRGFCVKSVPKRINQHYSWDSLLYIYLQGFLIINISSGSPKPSSNCWALRYPARCVAEGTPKP